MTDIQRAIDCFRAEGFVLTDHREASAFGDLVLEFRRETLAVRLVRDRSQWAVLIFSGESWRDLDLWRRAFLDGDLLSPPVSTLAPQLSEVISLSHQLLELLKTQSSEHLEQTLRETGVKRFKARASKLSGP